MTLAKHWYTPSWRHAWIMATHCCSAFRRQRYCVCNVFKTAQPASFAIPENKSCGRCQSVEQVVRFRENREDTVEQVARFREDREDTVEQVVRFREDREDTAAV